VCGTPSSVIVVCEKRNRILTKPFSSFILIAVGEGGNSEGVEVKTDEVTVVEKITISVDVSDFDVDKSSDMDVDSTETDVIGAVARASVGGDGSGDIGDEGDFI